MRNEKLIQTIYECAAACNHCADACLEEENVGMMLRCIRLDRICGTTCEATAKNLSVEGLEEQVRMLVKTCGEICRECAQECGKHQHKHCQECARACEECAEACSQFAA